jgi:hypothetical protein
MAVVSDPERRDTSPMNSARQRDRIDTKRTKGTKNTKKERRPAGG